MSAPSDEDLSLIAREIVFEARKAGRLEHYTKGLIRERMEQHFKVASGSLKPRKKVINAAIEEAMDADDEDVEMKDGTKVDGDEGSPSTKDDAKQSSKAQPSEDDKGDAEPHAADSDNDNDTVSPKKPTKKTSKKIPSASTKLKRADKNTTDFVNMLGLGGGSGGDEQAAAILMGALGGDPKKRMEMKSDSEFSVLEDAPPKKKAKRASKDKSDAKSKKKVKETNKPAESSGLGSGSEMSVLEDSPPAKAKAKTTTKKREPKAEKVEDKDEAEIKRLKSFVVACGVRKKWAKEFEGMPSSNQQIAHLKRILTELGMTGRLSLEKAKDIREKRELAKEIEDVKEFDAKVNGPRASRSSKASAKKAMASASEDAEDEQEADSDEGPSSKPVKRKSNKSILAFLDDQSSD
ncbi:hypothetical protein FRB94_007340 [Tulasnella sp. JGI-2019a]|nr:hypothetical protein FRB94_007340 [Tulasnella sp. JGI-2019a]KAG9013262.1 hypothetical protein FRB93_000785 [Tulasnella sp. JGI-2019a]